MNETQTEEQTALELADVMESAARRVARILSPAGDQGPYKSRYVLLVYGHPDLPQWISNCTEEEVLGMIRATEERIEAH